ncbi:CRISPR-associated protein, Csh1 family [Methanosarcina barkeri 3]|uniref:CRISPR-associated protein, Csh1 family n=1 Tax=Methanosarcina barkeri 3 TaxID=1434107 RepID=A0A0E3SP75_METBA|nr:TIGR02556 family CRISPR-associated protein [Methanosarcina barkeri]AKB83393.1 CRISPR-associated protein, Csh1 family [Methanosarcina barkeri 3]
MIEAMKEIGEYALEKENKDLNDFVSILVENPASNETYKHVLCIKITYSDGNFEFKEIEHQEYSKEKIVKYLYKRGSSNGPDITPTARVTEIKKTFSNKIISWFSKPLKEAKPILDSEEVQFLELLGDCIKKNEKKILLELEPKINSIDAKENSILTLILEENDFIRYVGDFEAFRKILKNNGASKFYSKYSIISKADDKLCSVCKTHKEVYGFVTPYEFYTVDKRGFVSGGFDQSKAWKNNPVCLECALKITAGKEYIEKYMSFGFYGFNFLLIPKLLNNSTSENLFDIFEKFNEKKFAFNKEYKNFLQDNESDILEILSEEDDYLNFNFQFYEKSNSAYRILLYIEDVLPSRLRELFRSKEIVDKRKIFRNYYFSDTEEKSIQFTLGNVRWFFPNTLDDPDLDKYFLEITNGMFTGASIDYNFLLKYIMRRIRKDFRSENPTKYSLYLGFQMLDFLSNLCLLGNYTGGKCVNSTDLSSLLSDTTLKENDGYEERTNIIFSEFEHFFNTDAKKAIFLEGTLAQYLLNIQKFQRGSTPFRTKLRGLSFDERYTKRIFPEIINKLEEYDANYYKELEYLIAKYMIQSGTGWKMSNDEISFYFVLGMNLSNLLKPPKPEKGDKK